MYISQLVINGFKTFNSKTSLEFGDGITVIVGPNGCGKTNIVDAIRWVLGEQKHSMLRSSQMEDVIFNGAKGTKPTSMCEVFLTIKNDKEKLPIEYTDVEIGRRLYRDGDSDYFINRTACRLKDINNLFVDTGMGADSYSVIELNMIEQILSETNNERKFLFEEAAGINKYKTQRRLSIKKFEATKFDLDRIGDIVNEVEAKVKRLNLQLKRFKRHATLVEKLKSTEIDLGTLKINRYLSESDPIRKNIEEYSHLKDTKVSNQDNSEIELSKMRKVYVEQEKEILTMRNSITDYDVNREDVSQKILIWKEQNRSSKLDLIRLENEINSNKIRIVEYQNSVVSTDKEIEKIIPQIDAKLATFKLEQEKFDKIELTYKNEQNIVDEIQSKRWELQKEISENKSLIISTEAAIDERSSSLNQLNKKIVNEEKDIDQLKIDDKTYVEKYQTINDQIAESIDKKEKLEKEINLRNQELKELETKRQSQSSKLESNMNQLNFYQELVVSRADSPRGLKYIQDNDIYSKSVIGTVSDIISTEEKYEVAINSALGNNVHLLICKTREDALAILGKVQKDDGGSISIIALDAISNKLIDTVSIPKNSSVIDAANKLVSVKKKYKPIIDILLYKVQIVNDITQTLIDPKLKDWTLIDLKGTTYRNSIFKYPGSGKTTVIGRNEKIELLKTKCQKNWIKYQVP